MNCIKKIISLMMFCCCSIMLFAQQAPYGVKGTVVDVESFKPLAGVTVTIANSKLGTTTNEKGEFFISLPNDKSIEYLVRASLLGYEAQELTFSLNKADTEFVSFALKNSDAIIEEVVVTRKREKATELALLEERKKSNLMLESIGAQELSRKGVSDARAALTKMAGVSRQEGVRNVLVRGLGDRFNSTSLNGLPLPSEDPLYKNISLDFFSSDVIQSINVNKTFNPMIAGDVAGANIDIYTKEATGNSFQLSVAGGANSQTISQKDFKRINGTNYFGTLKGGSKHGITDLSSYNFKNTWDPKQQGNLFNSSYKLVGNRRFMIGNNPLSLFVMANMDSKYRYSNGKIQQTDNGGHVMLDQDFTENEYTVSQSGMLNLRYGWKNNYINFNSLYIHDQKQSLLDFLGKDEGTIDGPGDKVFVRRSQVNDNHVFVNQLLSKLEINDKWSSDLGVGFNYIIGNEPDRRIYRYFNTNNNWGYPFNSPGENERYFANMDEAALVAKAILTYKLENSSDLDRKIDFGYNGNFAQRNFKWTEFNHKINPASLPTPNIYSVDGFFNNDNVGKYFNLQTNRGGDTDAERLLPYFYKGTKRINSGIAQGTYQFDPNFTAVLGLRLDNVYQSISYETNLPDYGSNNFNKISKNFILPSLNLKYVISDNMLLRASGAKTYTLPQFIELAPVRYRGNNTFTQGNPNLKPSETIHADIKWELYPESGELFSVGAFFKNINNPIAQVEAGGAGSTLSFFNVGAKALVLGAEAEIKKDLIRSDNAHGQNVLTGGLNISYLYSDQKLSIQGMKFDKESDQLEGASPLLINADLTYKLFFNNVELMPTVLLNYFSDRIFSYGTSGFKNIMEKGIARLDFNTQATINKRFGVNLKIENILNPDRQLYRDFEGNQPRVFVEKYKRGVDFSLGLSYKF